jgi:hypothetical protein
MEIKKGTLAILKGRSGSGDYVKIRLS